MDYEFKPLNFDYFETENKIDKYDKWVENNSLQQLDDKRTVSLLEKSYNDKIKQK